MELTVLRSAQTPRSAMWKLLGLLVLFTACRESAASPPPSAASSPPASRPGQTYEDFRACSSGTDCTVIPTYCGGIAGVSRSAQSEARRYFDEIGGLKKCRAVEPLALPAPACLDGRCQPGMTFPR